MYLGSYEHHLSFELVSSSEGILSALEGGGLLVCHERWWGRGWVRESARFGGWGPDAKLVGLVWIWSHKVFIGKSSLIVLSYLKNHNWARRRKCVKMNISVILTRLKISSLWSFQVEIRWWNYGGHRFCLLNFSRFVWMISEYRLFIRASNNFFLFSHWSQSFLKSSSLTPSFPPHSSPQSHPSESI